MAPSRTKGRKAGTIPNEKVHWKKPGFNAFGDQSTRGKSSRQLVRHNPVAEPESGIHSLGWAEAIVPQNCGFLKLPYELRLKIYKLIFDDLSFRKMPIAPTKKGWIFCSRGWRGAARETTTLYSLCRQIYFDIVGGDLLYQFKPFSFNSPNLLLNFLWVIKPAHRNFIRTLRIQFRFRRGNQTLDAKALSTLASCRSLQHLTIEIEVHFDLLNFHFANGTVAAIPARPPQLIRPAPPEQPLFGVVGYEVPENMLGAIRDCEGLREIKGLLSFNLRIELDWYSTRLSRYHRVPDESHRNQARLEEFEEELRRVLVKA